MTLIDPPPRKAFDATPFVTYTSEEDVTPTAGELVEDLPHREPTQQELAAAEKPLWRGKGYLRAEAMPESAPAGTDASAATNSSSTPVDDFGAGVMAELSDDASAAADDSVSPGQQVDSKTGSRGPVHAQKTGDVAADQSDALDGEIGGSNTTPTSNQGESGRKTGRRRRRPRGRRRGKADGGSNGNASNAASGTAENSDAAVRAKSVRRKKPSGEHPSGTSETSQSAEDGSPKKKRNRRRRRRKGG